MFESLFVIYPSSLRLSGNITNKLLTSRCISAHIHLLGHGLYTTYIMAIWRHLLEYVSIHCAWTNPVSPILCYVQKLLTRVLVEDISGQIETSTASETKSEDTPPVSVEAVEHSAHEPHVCTASLQSNEGVLMQSAVQEVNTSSVRDSQELGRDCAVSVAPVCAPDDAGDCDRVENSRAVMDSEAGFELPPLPQTSFELQSHWKQLRDSRPQLIAYFKVHVQYHLPVSYIFLVQRRCFSLTV